MEVQLRRFLIMKNIKIVAREIIEFTSGKNGMYKVLDLVVIDNDYTNPCLIVNNVRLKNGETQDKLSLGLESITPADAFLFQGEVEKSKVKCSKNYRIKSLKVENLNYDVK